MLLEGLRLAPTWGRVVYLAMLAAAGAALAHQIAAGYSADIAGGEVTIDRYALVAKSVMVGLGFAALFAGLGAWGPARRAARVDPASALSHG